MNNLNLQDALGQLHSTIEEDFKNMMGVHRIRKPGKRIPAWALDDVAVRRLLLTSFPKLLTNRKQRERASRWNQIITLYFRLNMSKTEVAQEIGLSHTIVHRAIQRIHHVAAGLRANGSPRGGKRGRPRKTLLGLPHIMGVQVCGESHKQQGQSTHL